MDNRERDKNERSLSGKRVKRDEPAKALTIGGSDSGGAAGLQADLKTWTALGVYGMSAITAVTAQNSVEVAAITFMSSEIMAAQIRAVLSDYGAQAVKTGFIGRSELVRTIAVTLKEQEAFTLVVDPVLVNHRGSSMFEDDVIQAYRDTLLPMSALITPNWREAMLLVGEVPRGPVSPSDIQGIATKLHTLGAAQILITGDRQNNEMVDYWFDGQKVRELRNPHIETLNVHGSGDTLSAAICAYLAQADSMEAAINKGRDYTAGALRRAVTWRLGAGHGPLSHFL